MEEFLRPNETMEQLVFRCTNLSIFDCSEEEMLSVGMGPVRLPLREALPVSATLLLLFLTGVSGNLAVCLVIARRRAMRTPTNYYLFSLAISDLLLLVFGLPNDLTLYWHQYPYSLGIPFCKLRALISEAASYVSVLTIVAFSLERYMAICHPLQLYAMAGLRRAPRIVAALWVLSLVAASPFAVYTTVNYHEYPPGSGKSSLKSAFCAMLKMPSWYLCELSSFLFFVLPALVIVYLYIRMGLTIRSTNAHKPGRHGALNGLNGSIHGEARKSKRNIVRMLAAVVVAFFVCWAPFHVQRLFFIYGVACPFYHVINQHLFSAAGMLYYVSATVNPILYNVMSHRYRVAFQETLCCGKPKRKRRRCYKGNSNIKETTVNHTTDGVHLVRVRSLNRDKLSKTDYQDFNSSSFHKRNSSYKNIAGFKRKKMKQPSVEINDLASNNNELNEIDTVKRVINKTYKEGILVGPVNE